MRTLVPCDSVRYYAIHKDKMLLLAQSVHFTDRGDVFGKQVLPLSGVIGDVVMTGRPCLLTKDSIGFGVMDGFVQIMRLINRTTSLCRHVTALGVMTAPGFSCLAVPVFGTGHTAAFDFTIGSGIGSKRSSIFDKQAGDVRPQWMAPLGYLELIAIEHFCLIVDTETSVDLPEKA